MLMELKKYRSEDSPKDEELSEGLAIAKENNCYVVIEWYVKYSGAYYVFIRPDAEMEQLRAQIPKRYGI